LQIFNKLFFDKHKIRIFLGFVNLILEIHLIIQRNARPAMTKTIAISAIVLVAVVMGMSAMAPALAVGPPAEPPAGQLPEITCDELEEALAELDVPEDVKNNIRDLANCPVP